MTMNKNTGRRTVTTTNIVTYSTGIESASCVWDEEQVIGLEYTLDLMTRAFTEDNLDAHGYRRPADVFEFEFPGQRFVVFMYDGQINTVITVEDEFIGRLHKAIRREHPVTVGYTKQYDGEDTVRTIEPTSLRITKSGAVTLGGRDRKSGEYRSFRVDHIADVTTHRSKFIIDDAYVARARAAHETAKVQRIRQTAQRVVVGPQGYVGTTSPESAGFSASGWSVIVHLDEEYASVTPTASVRAGVDVLDIIPERVTTEDAFRALAVGRARSTSYTPAQRAAWRTLSKRWA